MKNGKMLQFPLDKALWHLYIAIRHSEGILMAVEFMHNGRLWRADTDDEAIRLRQKLEAQDRIAADLGEEPDIRHESVWTPDLALELLKSARPSVKQFLRLLFDKAQVSDAEVIKKLSLDSELAFAGVLSGISKQLKKLKLKPWDLYTTRVEWQGKEKSRFFALSPDFKWIAIEVGWPEKWH